MVERGLQEDRSSLGHREGHLKHLSGWFCVQRCGSVDVAVGASTAGMYSVKLGGESD